MTYLPLHNPKMLQGKVMHWTKEIWEARLSERAFFSEVKSASCAVSQSSLWSERTTNLLTW